MPKKSISEDIPDLPEGKQEEVLRSLPEGVPDLGPVVAVDRQETTLLQRPDSLALLAGLGAVIAAVLWGVYPTLRPDEQPVVLVFGVIAAALAAACAALAAAMAARPFHSRGTHWVFLRDGLVRVRWGRRADVFPWGELEVRKLASGPVVKEYQLSAPGREPVRLTHGLIGGRLVRKIQDMQALAVLPALRSAVAAGEEVPFGPLRVSREGLQHRRRVLPWRDAAPLEFAAAYRDGWEVTLTLRSHGGGVWSSVQVTDNVPNAWLFYQLVTALHPRLEAGASEAASLRGWLA